MSCLWERREGLRHHRERILEGLNSLVQAAKAKARGYKTFKNLKTMIYMLTGKLDVSQGWATHLK